MKVFDFAVQLRCLSSDVSMADAEICSVPMELGLEFMAVVGTDSSDSKVGFFDDVFAQVDCFGTGVLFGDFVRSNASCIIDGGEPKAANFTAVVVF